MFIIPNLHDSIESIEGKTYRRFFLVSLAKYLPFKKEHKDGIATKAGFQDPVLYVDTRMIANILSL